MVGGASEETPQEGSTMRVILVAARKTEIERLFSAAKDAGLQLNAIDVDIFALTNLFAFVQPETKEHAYAMVDFGAVDSSLAMLNKGELVFSRDVAFGGNDLTEFIKRKLNVSLEEALKVQCEGGNEGVIEEGLSRLFQELRSSVNYYYNQHEGAPPIEKIYVSGGLSQLTFLRSSLEKQMEVPVNTWDPIPAFQLGKEMTPETLKNLTPYLPVALGLGIRPT